jgi:hypothetical protein
MQNLRLNETIMTEEIDWNKLYNYTDQFGIKTLKKKIDLIRKITVE